LKNANARSKIGGDGRVAGDGSSGQTKGEKVVKATPTRWARLSILAVLAAAIAAAAFTAAGHSRSAVHAMTPAVGATPLVQNLGALGAPANQPGRLRQCQLDGTCYGPNQIRNAYGFQPLLNKGITGAGSTIVIIDAYGSNTLQQDFDLNNGY
jgi:hypothetical protein